MKAPDVLESGMSLHDCLSLTLRFHVCGDQSLDARQLLGHGDDLLGNRAGDYDQPIHIAEKPVAARDHHGWTGLTGKHDLASHFDPGKTASTIDWCNGPRKHGQSQILDLSGIPDGAICYHSDAAQTLELCRHEATKRGPGRKPPGIHHDDGAWADSRIYFAERDGRPRIDDSHARLATP